MNLLKLAGLAKEPPRSVIGDEGMAALVLAAEKVIRAGVVLSPEFWAGCCDYEQEAIVIASDRVAVSRAALYGAASLGLRQAAMMADATSANPSAVKAVDDAEELAKNKLAAQQMANGSKLVNAVEVDKIQLPPEVEAMIR